MYGGTGSDTFVFAAGSGTEILGDFEDGIDKIRFSSGVTDFSSLTFFDPPLVCKIEPFSEELNDIIKIGRTHTQVG